MAIFNIVWSELIQLNHFQPTISFLIFTRFFTNQIQATANVWFIWNSNDSQRIWNLNLDRWSLNESGVKSKLNCEPSDQQQSSEDDAHSAAASTWQLLKFDLNSVQNWAASCSQLGDLYPHVWLCGVRVCVTSCMCVTVWLDVLTSRSVKFCEV